VITQTENTEARRYYAGFMTQCQAYKDLLTAAGLPLSVDMAELTDAYRQQLFDGLLKVDKGLKARFDLLRTDEARRKLITDTINLDGHDVLDDATAALQQLEQVYKQIGMPDGGPLHQAVHFISFANLFGLDFGKELDSQTINWGENQHVLEHFEVLAAALTPWLRIVRKTMNSSANMEHAGMLLAEFFTTEGPGLASDKVVVKDKVLHARMKSQKVALHIPKP
jgi:hypothetical protein